LRRAIALPWEFQKFTSSGLQSEIQVEFRLLITVFLSGRDGSREVVTATASQGVCQRYLTETLEFFQGS